MATETSLKSALAKSESASEMQSLTLTQLAARRLETIRGSELTVEVQGKAVTCLLDYLGALTTGLSAPWSGALLDYARASCPAGGGCYIMGLTELLSAEVAAFTNAAIAHRQVTLTSSPFQVPTAVA